MLSDKRKGFLFVALSGILSGTIVFGGKVLSDFGFSLFQVSTLPYLIAAIFVLPFLFKSGFSGFKKSPKLLVLYAFVSAGTVLCQFGGVVFGVSVAVVVLLLYAQPLWTILISHFFLKEKISLAQVIAGVLVLVGVFLLVDPSSLFGSQNLVGVLFALLGGVFLSLWVVVGSLTSKKNISPFLIFFTGSAGGAIFCILFYPVLLFLSPTLPVVGLSFDLPVFVFVLLFVFSLVSVIGAHIFYYLGAKRLPTITSGIIMLLEPLVGVILSTVFLSQPVTIFVVFGGFLILLGNLLVILRG